MAGVIVSVNASVDPSTGHLTVRGTAVATGGGVATITVAAVESLVNIGTGNATVPADGNSYDWAADVPAAVGAWTSGGSGVANAILFDATNFQIATGQQLLAIY